MVNPINLQVVGKLHMLGLQKKTGDATGWKEQ